jgi:mannose-6-phosphate isomerase
MLYPLIFHPIFKERIWGGRNLERLYGKALPPNQVIGESWEISDRPEGVSVVANGVLAGRSLRWLMEQHRSELLGAAPDCAGRFPLLLKILDAQDRLSLQVHPPASVAPRLGGEPKTEMWYITDATPTAELFVGLRRGVTRSEFEHRLAEGTVADCFHRLAVQRGDAMFLPSGRVHAIGAGSVIFEIQQNSDTTYRVFDWNRKDAQGRPRDLHIAESLESIDFTDFEPGLAVAELRKNDGIKERRIVSDELFSVTHVELPSNREFDPGKGGVFTIVAVVSGELELQFETGVQRLVPGAFILFPADSGRSRLQARTNTQFLFVTPGLAT